MQGEHKLDSGILLSTVGDVLLLAGALCAACEVCHVWVDLLGALGGTRRPCMPGRAHIHASYHTHDCVFGRTLAECTALCAGVTDDAASNYK